uniref:DUF3533 domain-containing protein n=2 Tax=Cohnella candidum TaxID=2674991 RepID=A0A3G3K2W0_9BACL|nr:DUF3533 domain-containing protein [Cohnella candidum]
MKMFVQQKFVRIAVIAVTVVLMVFGLAMMGSVLGAKPQGLPIALVVLDKPAELPTGGELAAGGMVKEKVTGLAQLPVKWKVLGTEGEAAAAMDRQEVYGALVLPADFSAGLLSIQSPEPKPSTVKLYYNEGMSAQGVAAAKSILQQVAKNVSAELSAQLLEQVGQRVQQISVGSVHALLAPFGTQEISVHPVGSNNGGGSAPNMLTQIIWMGCLVMSVLLFFASKAATVHGGRRSAVAGQTVIGLALAAGASGFLVWMAHSWYGMEIADQSTTWLFLWLAASAFFLMQTALFNWIGIPAVAILVLLLFFSLPVLNLAPEFMPQATQDWLYSWTPFRYVASGLRNLMYFGGEHGMGLSYGVLWGIAGVSLAAVLASALRKGRVQFAAGGSAGAAPAQAR